MLSYKDKLAREAWLDRFNKGLVRLTPKPLSGHTPSDGIFDLSLEILPEWVVVGHRCQSINRWGQCNEAVYPDINRKNVPRLCRTCRKLYKERGWGLSPRKDLHKPKGVY